MFLWYYYHLLLIVIFLETSKYSPNEYDNDVFDCNGFYAGRLETDGDNLYVVGWCGTKKNHQDGDEYDWGGNMVTHMLKQNSDGTLNPVVPPAIESTMKNVSILEIFL